MSAMNILMLAGGLGLFLYGMTMMGEGLELAAGSRLRKMLEALTTNRFLAVLVGAAVTGVIQSSSATTVMVVGFVNAGLMNLAQAVGVIMGANIGTTVTSQLIALKLTSVAPIAVFIGVGIMMFSKRKNTRHIGQIIAGLGILFMGMNIMGESLAPLKESTKFAEFMITFKNPLFGILAGALFTGVIQSSSASIGILQALAMQGLIGLDGAVFILLGQNIGTCVTALISSIGTSVTARRAAIIHLMFNVLGTIIFGTIMMILPVVDWITALAPNNTVAQIANTHTLFNIATTLLLFPAANLLVRLSCLIVPGKEVVHEEMQVKFIDERILTTPPIAVAQVIKEVDRMGSLARKNFSLAMKCFFSKDDKDTALLMKEVSVNEKVINLLNREITKYLVKIYSSELNDHDYKTIGRLFHTVSDIERIGDHAENIIEYAQQRFDEKLPFSEVAFAELQEMTARVEGIIDQAIAMFHSDNHDPAVFSMVMEAEEGIDERTRELRNKHVNRLTQGDCNATSGMIFIDLLTNMERAADHAVNIAQAVNS